MRLIKSEYDELKDKLIHLQKLENAGRLLNGIVHDFNNVLTCISGYAGILETNGRNNKDIIDSAHCITRNVTRAQHLSRAILNFSNFDKINMKSQTKKKPLDINNLLKQIIALTEGIFEKKVKIELMLDQSVKSIVGDYDQCDQVFSNLIINAKDAMPNGGVLQITTEKVPRNIAESKKGLRKADYVKIIISDTGAGMSKEVLKKIYNAGFTTKKKGNGLGLFSSYEIVKSLNGIIEVESEINVGTSFSIYLPATYKDENPQPDNNIIYRGHGETILLIDDEEDIVETTAYQLNRLGYKTIGTLNGYDALATFNAQHHNIDLVILDLLLPGISGQEILSELIKINKNTKVIICSGLIKDDIRVKSLNRKEVVGFVQKPFNIYELSKELHCVLGEIRRSSAAKPTQS